MIAQRRDENEPQIVFEFVRQGWDITKQDRMAGFDLLAVKGNRARIVEVKDPRKYWKLTDREFAKKQAIESVGGEYEIILYPNQV